jgi:hypothetical protein
MFANRKIIIMGLHLIGLFIILLSIRNIANIFYLQQGYNFFILEHYVGPFIYLLVGLYLKLASNRFITIFIRQKERVEWNIIYIIMILIGYIFIILGFCNLIITVITFVLGSTGSNGSNIIDNYIDNFVYDDMDIVTPLINFLLGTIMALIAPFLTNLVTRNNNL